MLNSLNFVKGAIAKKSLLPELSHFKIRDGFITSFNGTLSLCSPIPINLEAAPKAIQFIKAIEACKEPVSMHLTKANRLGIKSGSFKAFIDCLENDEVQEIMPSGSRINSPGDFLQAIRKLSPFIAEDASRKWARGILFKGQSLFATNNICLIEHWLPSLFPFEANVPQETIRELLRIGEEPTEIQIDTNTITFHFSGDRWLASQLYETTWPDLQPILNIESNQQNFPQGFFEALKTLVPFADDQERLYLFPNRVSTTDEEQTGSSVDITTNTKQCIFNLKQLLKLEIIANTIDFSLFPKPCVFYGDCIRGAIVGMAN